MSAIVAILVSCSLLAWMLVAVSLTEYNEVCKCHWLTFVFPVCYTFSFGKKLGMRKANMCSYLQIIPAEVDQITRHVVLGGLLIFKNFKRFLCIVWCKVSLEIQDTFTRCFKSNAPEPWNWNLYLFPLWVMGVIVRYGILFPIRSPALYTLWS